MKKAMADDLIRALEDAETFIVDVMGSISHLHPIIVDGSMEGYELAARFRALIKKAKLANTRKRGGK